MRVGKIHVRLKYNVFRVCSHSAKANAKVMSPRNGYCYFLWNYSHHAMLKIKEFPFVCTFPRWKRSPCSYSFTCWSRALCASANSRNTDTLSFTLMSIFFGLLPARPGSEYIPVANVYVANYIKDTVGPA